MLEESSSYYHGSIFCNCVHYCPLAHTKQRPKNFEAPGCIFTEGFPSKKGTFSTFLPFSRNCLRKSPSSPKTRRESKQVCCQGRYWGGFLPLPKLRYFARYLNISTLKKISFKVDKQRKCTRWNCCRCCRKFRAWKNSIFKVLWIQQSIPRLLYCQPNSCNSTWLVKLSKPSPFLLLSNDFQPTTPH